MSGALRLNGSTSGYSELKAPDVAGDQEFVFPSDGGTLMTEGSNLTITLDSGNLDVGDRLKKADDALTAIKAAVSDTSTDLAGLKAAILAALANH